MKIVFDCGSGGPSYFWSGDSINDGIGGSEEAVAYLSRELASLGHDVRVINNCKPPEDGKHILTLFDSGGSLGWIPYTQKIDLDGDIYVAWRNWRFYERGANFKKRYLHCHDIAVEPHWNPQAAQHFDRVIMLNNHHKMRYQLSDEKAFVMSNGVDVSQFQQTIERIPHSCVFISHPHRGLNELRAYWPAIREAVPDATLSAYWWQKEFHLPPNDSLGIRPMKSLGHYELAAELLRSDILSYPSTFSPEVNPISCIKAQCGGAFPVVVLQGGMQDTLIPPYHETSHQRYIDTLIFELNNFELREKIRPKMMADAQGKFDWKKISQAWIQEFEAELAK